MYRIFHDFWIVLRQKNLIMAGNAKALVTTLAAVTASVEVSVMGELHWEFPFSSC